MSTQAITSERLLALLRPRLPLPQAKQCLAIIVRRDKERPLCYVDWSAPRELPLHKQDFILLLREVGAVLPEKMRFLMLTMQKDSAVQIDCQTWLAMEKKDDNGQ